MSKRAQSLTEPKAQARPAAQYDLVVFGATSFVGQIICRHLMSRIGINQGVNWAIAGRSRDKLEALRAELLKVNSAQRNSLKQSKGQLDLLEADARNESSLLALCGQTRVVMSTVGPYALYGEALVKAAVQSGIDYCDLTGEPQWIRLMLQRYESAAKASGARIVHACGFDSVPSDLGVWFMQQAAKQRFSQPLVRISMRVKRIRGGASGGTVASMLNAVTSAIKNKAERRDFANPYSLCLDADAKPASRPRQFNQKSARFDPDFRAWSAPFIMAAINSRVVFRSQHLQPDQFGQSFLYDEAMLTGSGLAGRVRALSIAGGLAAFMTAAVLSPTRWAMQKLFLPEPGEGPSESAQREGFFDLRFIGRTSDGQVLRAKVTGDRDPGYGSTAKMISEVALCLLDSQGKSSFAGLPTAGFPTPSVALGQSLLDALEANAGLKFTLEDRA